MSPLRSSAFGEVERGWGWLLAFGVLAILLGLWGLGMAVFVTLATVVLYGVILLVSGGAQFIHSFKCSGWNSRLWHVVISLLYIAAGIVVIRNPLLASGLLTIVLAIVIVAVGFARLAMAIQLRGERGWVWVLLGGIAALVLGLLILGRWPTSSLVVIGIFVSIELIMNGWAALTVALAAKAVAKASE